RLRPGRRGRFEACYATDQRGIADRTRRYDHRGARGERRAGDGWGWMNGESGQLDCETYVGILLAHHDARRDRKIVITRRREIAGEGQTRAVRRPGKQRPNQDVVEVIFISQDAWADLQHAI